MPYSICYFGAVQQHFKGCLRWLLSGPRLVIEAQLHTIQPSCPCDRLSYTTLAALPEHSHNDHSNMPLIQQDAWECSTEGKRE